MYSTCGYDITEIFINKEKMKKNGDGSIFIFLLLFNEEIRLKN
jgi:hypothetical protein